MFALDKDTKHVKDQSTGTNIEYTKEKGKGKINQLNVGNEKDQYNSSGSYNPQIKNNQANKQ